MNLLKASKCTYLVFFCGVYDGLKYTKNCAVESTLKKLYTAMIFTFR